MGAKNSGIFAAMENRHPRENFFFILYSEQANTYWVTPSLELVKEANQNKTGINKGNFTIVFAKSTRNGVNPQPRLKNMRLPFPY
jgi:hypothetical protein